ncbi:M4 family metallopeptidase [Rhodothermus profundi]|uniref:Por secretion system C-terminal sorting domain-containing protein n=1 Tax=Rhodothermus profundi TaxID=633813 RepID=A0A1M6P316_9BACT|nr:M4 family metallopeptidase [Rhodothermus profundi]SHK02331.1 Por secretion system C-terminal sorting domain-containing protein [Rhodothermus profundi]
MMRLRRRLFLIGVLIGTLALPLQAQSLKAPEDRRPLPSLSKRLNFPILKTPQALSQAFRQRHGSLLRYGRPVGELARTPLLFKKPLRLQELESPRLYRAPNGTVRWLIGQLEQVAGKRPQDLAHQVADFLYRNRRLLQLDNPREELRLVKISRDALGYTHLRYAQQYQGYPVWAAELRVHLDNAGRIYALNGSYEPTPADLADLTPRLTATDAYERAAQDLRKQGRWQPPGPFLRNVLKLDEQSPRLVLFRHEQLGWRLAYEVDIRPNWIERYTYLVDAQTGTLLHAFATHCSLKPVEPGAIPDEPILASPALSPLQGNFVDARAQDLRGNSRTLRVYHDPASGYYMIWDLPSLDLSRSRLPYEPQGGAVVLDAQQQDLSRNTSVLLVSSADNVWRDPVAVSAHWNHYLAFTFFHTQFNRNAIDNQGSTILSVIHVTENGRPIDNAFWNGRVMAYGDGARDFLPLAGNPDVGVHEMAHGVIEHTANLVYQFQPGALNESFADVFAVLATGDFQIGEGIVRPETGKQALRDLKNPGGNHVLAPQPAHMSEYRTLDITTDNGGVHINSGIPNRAAALLIEQIGAEKAGQIYYRALSQYLTRNSQFGDLRQALEQSARDLYGEGAELQAVEQAFDAVGISPTVGQGSDQGNDIPAPQVQASAIFFVLWDPWYAQYAGEIGVLDVTDPSNVQATLINTVRARFTQYEDGRLDVAQLSGTRDGRSLWFVDAEGYLTAIDLGSGQLYRFDFYLNQPGDLWNASISPDGSVAAIVSAYKNDATLYFWDGEQVYQLPLEPTSTMYVKIKTIAFPDVVNWSPNPAVPRIVFDALNRIQLGGQQFRYWSAYEVDFAKNFEIYSLIPAQTPQVSIGNPIYFPTNPDIVAFNLVVNDTTDVVIVDYEEGRLVAAGIPERTGGQVLDPLRPVFSPDGTQLMVTSPQNGWLVFDDGQQLTFANIIQMFGGVPFNGVWLGQLGEARQNRPPVASLRVDTTVGLAPLTVTFDASASSDPDGDALNFYWEFGDGTTGSGQRTRHTFQTPGRYTVWLAVVDAWGAVAYDSVAIEVRQAFTNAEAVRPLPTSLTLATLYPQPSRQRLILRLGSPTAAPLHIRVYDLLGRLVWQETRLIGQGWQQLRLHLPTLAAGRYYLELQQQSHVVRRTLVVGPH